MDTIKGMKRTVMCGQLREEHIGGEAVLMGWVAKARDMGGLIFVDIRDRSGISQIVFEPENAELIAKAAELKSEFVIAVRGTVRRRESVNDKIPTGQVEVLAEELRVLSKSDTPPFVVQDDVKAGEELRLKYRYLDLRRPEMQRTLETRHRITQIARSYYDENG
ncbi:MAG: Asp-tRNA(Asn)/Glu-tRNA(Gln) amidotransferase GatCAB subunit C, partial [Oscillospiraceae bacterium]|nr:Asp-tRNA(Asn)/Glu-tRNA(Gln) amidotransferase GatCAB subunit C [Oscillospiraceae bacterium]